MQKTILIGIDRDGTINKDENLFLGSQPDWKDKIEFLPGVIEGIKLLNTFQNTHCFILTNQSGVARSDLPLLTEERMHEVNQHLIHLLRQQGCHIKGYFACPYVDNKYLQKAQKKGYQIHPQYVHDNHPDLKPEIGMIHKAAKSLNKSIEECAVYVLGDRASDVEMGLNAKGSGILISSYKTKELGDEDKVLALQNKIPSKVYISPDFYDAAQWIVQDASKSLIS